MKINLDALKTFFDPHPGFAGTFFPIPGAVKKIANELDGTSMPLRDAIKKIEAVTNGKVDIYNDCIILKTKCTTPFGLATNYFRVICFKSPST